MAKTLHDSRLATTDDKGHRVYLHPEDVKGKWRTRRSQFYWVLILIYLVLPWVYLNGEQVILLDIPGREFHFFGHVFYGHDAPILVTILLAIPLFFGFITSIFGRVWCGWGCPQTVFIDAIYRKIEVFAEGTARQRKKLDRAPMSLEKAWRKFLKWTLFTIVSLHISHSFIGYFVGTRNLFEMSLHAPSENWTVFMFMISVTLLCLFDFGWFREQFCIIACPYGRLQSVMMDEHSLVVAYDDKRGEPRRTPETLKDGSEGDCISCQHCVKACPTGIDIRRGTQLECIACTNCIDACDEIMEKVGREPGLIRYTTEKELKGEKRDIIRPRNVVYLTALFIVTGVFFYVININQKLRVEFLRGSRSPYQKVVRNGTTEIVNHYKLTLDHKMKKPYELYFKIKGNYNEDMLRFVTPHTPLVVKEGHSKGNVFFRFDPKVLNSGSKRIEFEIYNGKPENNNQPIINKVINLVGPLK